MEKVYNAQDFASAYGIHEKTVRTWIKEGKINAFRHGIAWRIPAAEFDRLMGKKQEEKGGDC